MKEFEVLGKIGDGAFSTVLKVKRRSDGKEYALKRVKIMGMKEKERENALNEVRLLASIDHPNIISYKEAFFEEYATVLCLVMEFADGGDLMSHIERHRKAGTFFSERELWNIFVQIVRGLKALHDLKIMHRDIKSANVYLTKEGVVKLGDLNVSKIAKSGMLYTQTGTPYYASPEVWKDLPYDNKSDIWSLGCVLYEMATLKPPFQGKGMKELYLKVVRGDRGPNPTNYSPDVSSLIHSLLVPNPASRPSCDEILQKTEVTLNMGSTLKNLEPEKGPAGQLLDTIRVSSNISRAKIDLPKPKYNPPRRNLSFGPKSRSFSESKELGNTPKNVIRSKPSEKKDVVVLRPPPLPRYEELKKPPLPTSKGSPPQKNEKVNPIPQAKISSARENHRIISRSSSLPSENRPNSGQNLIDLYVRRHHNMPVVRLQNKKN